MWLALLYRPSEEARNEVILCAWERGHERPCTVAGPLHAVADMARMLRQKAARSGAPPLPPRCDACLKPFDLPSF
jgi:hypothetical protein